MQWSPSNQHIIVKYWDFSNFSPQNSHSVQFSSISQFCLTLCDPQHARHPCPTPTPRSLLKLISIESVMPSSHLILCHPRMFLPSIFPAPGSFPMSQFFASGGQRIAVSASASVLPMNIQDWFHLGLTGWISLLSKGLWRVFSNTTVQKHQFFGTQLSSQSNFPIHTWPLEEP